MLTRIEYVILDAIQRLSEKNNFGATPKLISEETKIRPEVIRAHLTVLKRKKLVKTPVRGHYKLTKTGTDVLEKTRAELANGGGLID